MMIIINNIFQNNVNAVVAYFHWEEEYRILPGFVGLHKEIIGNISNYVDIVIGSHAHVTSGHYYYNDTLVLPQIGNLLFPTQKKKEV